MSSMHEIRALGMHNNNIVSDLEGMHLDYDVLTISLRSDKIKVTTNKKEIIKAGKKTGIYPHKVLVSTSDNGKLNERKDKPDDFLTTIHPFVLFYFK